MKAMSCLKMLVLAASLASAAGTAHAQFEARDLDGDGGVDAYYSPTQNLSWAADANLYATLGMPANLAWYSGPGHDILLPAGEVRHHTGLSFVDTVSIGGVDGWRLPSMLFPEWDGEGCPPGLCRGVAGTYASELGMVGALLTESNPFQNVGSGAYLSHTEGTWYQEHRTALGPVDGYMTDESERVSGHVWAVQAGDVGVRASVAPVPEPETYALMALGLGMIGVQLRRRLATATAPTV